VRRKERGVKIQKNTNTLKEELSEALDLESLVELGALLIACRGCA
jgi:hypothetical protein